jgi:hypothetical protein
VSSGLILLDTGGKAGSISIISKINFYIYSFIVNIIYIVILTIRESR